MATYKAYKPARFHVARVESPGMYRTNRKWRNKRAWFLRRNPLCVKCFEKGRKVGATNVDHIIPLSRGGSNHRINLQALCHSCHSRKTAAESGFGKGLPTGERG